MDEFTVNENLNVIENSICNFENAIFGDSNVNKDFGAFKASRIKEVLGLLKSQDELNKIRQKSISDMNSRGYGSLLNNFGLGQSSDSPSISLEGKKRDYYNKFDQINKFITPVKEILKKFKEEFPGKERVKQLLERCEECDNEINNLREIVRDF